MARRRHIIRDDSGDEYDSEEVSARAVDDKQAMASDSGSFGDHCDEEEDVGFRADSSVVSGGVELTLMPLDAAEEGGIGLTAPGEKERESDNSNADRDDGVSKDGESGEGRCAAEGKKGRGVRAEFDAEGVDEFWSGDGKAGPLPPVVPEAGWELDQYPSCMEMGAIQGLLDSLKWRLDGSRYAAYAPAIDQRASHVVDNRACFYDFQFRAGFHLPLHPFFATCLEGWGVAASQLNGNAWARLVTYFIACEQRGWPASFNVVRSFYQLRKSQAGWYLLHSRGKAMVTSTKSNFHQDRRKYFAIGVRDGNWGFNVNWSMIRSDVNDEVPLLAFEKEQVKYFANKPLTVEKLEDGKVVQEYCFPGRLWDSHSFVLVDGSLAEYARGRAMVENAADLERQKEKASRAARAAARAAAKAWRSKVMGKGKGKRPAIDTSLAPAAKRAQTSLTTGERSAATCVATTSVVLPSSSFAGVVASVPSSRATSVVAASTVSTAIVTDATVVAETREVTLPSTVAVAAGAVDSTSVSAATVRTVAKKSVVEKTKTPAVSEKTAPSVSASPSYASHGSRSGSRAGDHRSLPCSPCRGNFGGGNKRLRETSPAHQSVSGSGVGPTQPRFGADSIFANTEATVAWANRNLPARDMDIIKSYPTIALSRMQMSGLAIAIGAQTALHERLTSEGLSEEKQKLADESRKLNDAYTKQGVTVDELTKENFELKQTVRELEEKVKLSEGDLKEKIESLKLMTQARDALAGELEQSKEEKDKATSCFNELLAKETREKVRVEGERDDLGRQVQEMESRIDKLVKESEEEKKKIMEEAADRRVAAVEGARQSALYGAQLLYGPMDLSSLDGAVPLRPPVDLDVYDPDEAEELARLRVEVKLGRLGFVTAIGTGDYSVPTTPAFVEPVVEEVLGEGPVLDTNMMVPPVIDDHLTFLPPEDVVLVSAPPVEVVPVSAAPVEPLVSSGDVSVPNLASSSVVEDPIIVDGEEMSDIALVWELVRMRRVVG